MQFDFVEMPWSVLDLRQHNDVPRGTAEVKNRSIKGSDGGQNDKIVDIEDSTDLGVLELHVYVI